MPRAWIGALVAGLVILAQAVTRRSAALIGVVVAVGLATRASAQRPATAERRVARGDTTTALADFIRSAERQAGADTSWYNAGTLALQSRQFEVAEQALGAASRSLDPAIRFQALYNLGLAAIKQARADTSRRNALEEEAAARLKEALLLNPKSFAAKWNLELVAKRKPPSPPSSSSQRPKQGGGSQSPQQRPSSMSPTEAEQILRSVERAEQAVRSDQLKRRRVARSAGDKDW